MVTRWLTWQTLAESRSRKRSYLSTHLSMDSRHFQWIRQQESSVASRPMTGFIGVGVGGVYGLCVDWAISAGRSHVKTNRKVTSFLARRIESCNLDEWKTSEVFVDPATRPTALLDPVLADATPAVRPA